MRKGKRMKPGYYWVEYGNGEPEIAKLTKNSGWQFFDGRQHKMSKLREIKVLSQIVEPNFLEQEE